MFKCEDCGATFEEVSTYQECVGEYWGAPAYETFGCCPRCKSTEFEEVSEDGSRETV